MMRAIKSGCAHPFETSAVESDARVDDCRRVGGEFSRWLRALGHGPARSQFIRFLVVGIANTAFGYSAFATIFLLTGSYLIGIVFAPLAGLLFNFYTIGRVVFASRGWKTFPLFIVSFITICSVNFVLVNFLTDHDTHPLWAQLVALPIVVGLSYLLYARVVFRTT